jgi:hypothetical protein
MNGSDNAIGAAIENAVNPLANVYQLARLQLLLYL